MSLSKFNPFNIINVFAPQPKDPLYEKYGNKNQKGVTISSLDTLNRTPVFKAKTRKLSYAIILTILFDILGVVFYFDNKDLVQPSLYQVKVEDIVNKNSSAYENNQLVIFDKPRHTEAAIKRWVTSSLSDVYNFDYLNFYDRLDEIEKYFTETGYINFLKALKNINAYESIYENRLTINTIVFGEPLFPSVYGNKRITDGNLYYHVVVPMRMTVQKGNTITEYDTTFRVMLAVLVDNNGKTGFFIQEFDMNPPKSVR